MQNDEMSGLIFFIKIAGYLLQSGTIQNATC